MTFTLVAFEPTSGMLGVATASRSLAVGKSVPAIDPTAGAVASQAWTNPALRHHMLAALRTGATAEEAVARIPALDDDEALRQVAVVDRFGTAAVHTGARATAWAGHIVDEHYAVVGNVLTGPDVLDAMAAAYGAATTGPYGDAALHSAEPSSAGAVPPGPPDAAPALSLARRMLLALRAGESAGGDARGKESAALMVAPVGDAHFSPPCLEIDLRVDHHDAPLDAMGSMLKLTDPAG